MIPLVCCGKPKRLGGGQRRQRICHSGWICFLIHPPRWRSRIRRGWDSGKQAGHIGSGRQVACRYLCSSLDVNTYSNMQVLCSAYSWAGGRSQCTTQIPLFGIHPARPPLIQKPGTSLITREGARFFSVRLSGDGGREAGGNPPAYKKMKRGETFETRPCPRLPPSGRSI